MSWLFVALSAYLFLAVANLFDKFLVDNVIKNSKAYAFVACFLGAIVFLVAPWFLDWPGINLFVLNLLNGAVFALALCLLYEALRRGEASRVLVFIGGLTPVFSLIFSLLFFKEHFSSQQLIGISFSLSGVFLIAFLPQQRGYLSRLANKLKISLGNKNNRALLIAFFSALAYSIYFISTKTAYNGQEFISAFIWTRIGSALFVLLFLFEPAVRKEIRKMLFNKEKEPKKNSGFLVIVNQLLGSAGFILQNYAIFLGSVVLVNALQGLQYALLLILSAVLAALAPKLLKESFSWRIMFWKIAAVIMIAIGFYFLALK
jgi:drug/metabolite transporter (DMT)-like permease